MANEPSTTDLIQLKGISDGLLILKDDSVRGVVEITAINFELRSSEEQQAIIEQFQGFLNSIDFPFQIVVQSRKFDITAYLANVEQASANLSNELLKVQANEYMRFVRELSELSNIMSKRFYVVLPLTVVAAATEESGKGMLSGIKGLFGKKKPAAPTTQQPTFGPEQLAVYSQQLNLRADLVISGLSGMGLRGALLGQEQLVALFNDLYNPRIPTDQKS